MKQLVVLTGATGYLGSRILLKLLASDFQVQAVVRPESNLKNHHTLHFKNALVWDSKRAEPESTLTQPVHTIIHCATEYGRDEISKNKITETNFDFACQVFNWGKASGMKTFINAGTSLDPQVSLYAASKAAFRDYLTQNRSCEILNLSLEHFYGPGDSPKKFVTWLIHELLADRKRIPLTLGEQSRDFIYIDDVVSAFEQALQLKSSHGFREWHVRAPQATSLRALAELLCELCSKKLETLGFGDLAYRHNEPMSAQTKLQPFTQTGWKPRVELTEGLKTTVKAEIANWKNS